MPQYLMYDNSRNGNGVAAVPAVPNQQSIGSYVADNSGHYITFTITDDTGKSNNYGRRVDAGVVTAINHGSMTYDNAYFFTRQLEKILAQVYKTKKAKLHALEQFSESTGTIDEINTKYTQRVFSHEGIAQLYTDQTDTIERVSLHAKEISFEAFDFAIGVGWTGKEILRAQANNVNLSSSQYEAAKRAHDESLDQVVYYGDAKAGLIGLFAHPNITMSNSPAGASGSTSFAQKTPDEIALELSDMVNSVGRNTKMVYEADTLDISTTVYQYLAQQRMSTVTKDTILDHIKSVLTNTNPSIQIRPQPMLDPRHNDAITDHHILAFVNDPDCICVENGNRFKVLPLEAINGGLKFEGVTTSTTAGLLIKHPLTLEMSKGMF